MNSVKFSKVHPSIYDFIHQNVFAGHHRGILLDKDKQQKNKRKWNFQAAKIKRSTVAATSLYAWTVSFKDTSGLGLSCLIN